MPAEMVAHRTFTLVRRGYDPGEVRTFLTKVAQGLDALTQQADQLIRREAELADELRSLREQHGSVNDESFLTERLGQEASKILQAAHAAAAEARARAERDARRIVAEATKKAEALNAEVESSIRSRSEDVEKAITASMDKATAEASARIERGVADADQIVSSAQQQGREMLRKARALRSEILGELVAKRKTLLVQVEQLQAGRDTLSRSLAELQGAVNDVAEQYGRTEEAARAAARAAVKRVEAEGRGGGIPAVDELVAEPDSAEPEPVSQPDPEAVIASIQEEMASTAERVRRDHPFPPPARPAGPIGGITGPTGAPSPAVTPGSQTGGITGPTGAPSPARPPALRATRSVSIKSHSNQVGDEAPVPVHTPSDEDGSPGSPDNESTGEVPVLDRRAAYLESRPPRVVQRRRGLMSSLFGRRLPEDGEAPSLPAGMRSVEPPAEPDSGTVRVLPVSQPTLAESVAPPLAALPGEPEPPLPVAGNEPSDPELDEAPDQDRDTGLIEPRYESGPEDEEAKEEVEPAGEPGFDIFAALRGQVEAEKRAYYGMDPSGEERGAAVPEAVEAQGGGEEPVGAGDGDSLTPLERRNGMLNPLVIELSRRVKRVLQDEQNELMDRVRLAGPKPPVELLGPVDEQEYRYRRAAVESIVKTASSGALFATGRRDISVSLPDDLVGGLASAMISWLRAHLVQRFEASGVDTAGNKSDAISIATGVVTSTYRECKASFLNQIVHDYSIAAFSRGILEGSGRQRTLQWVMDDGGESCPDCDDNVLAGPVRAWEEFPTGQAHPPAHSGCRCLVIPADR